MTRDTRNAILRGVSGAAETHDSFGLREKHDSGLSAIDVFGVIADLAIPLGFQDLDRLLGACVRVSSTEVGILVTTQRDLHMQRFTAAHELGHFVLEHEGSFDSEVRMPGHTKDRDPREIEADAFAAEFLMPKWLVRATALRRRWWAEAPLRSPDVVYQLSLRLAMSYEATCWGLVSHNFISYEDAKRLTSTKLKSVKKEALRDVSIGDSWADVWKLSTEDNRASIDAGPNDIFIFEMEECESTGLNWEIREAVEAGFELLEDRQAYAETVTGGAAHRRIVFRAPPAGAYNLCLRPRQSSAGAVATEGIVRTLSVSISTHGTRRNNLAVNTSDSDTMH